MIAAHYCKTCKRMIPACPGTSPIFGGREYVVGVAHVAHVTASIVVPCTDALRRHYTEAEQIANLDEFVLAPDPNAP